VNCFTSHENGMRYTDAPDISPRLGHRGKAVRRSYSAWRLCCGYGTPKCQARNGLPAP